MNSDLGLSILLEEVETQKVMFEKLIEKVMTLEAKLMALNEILVVNNVIDEDTIKAIESDNYYELLSEHINSY